MCFLHHVLCNETNFRCSLFKVFCNNETNIRVLQAWLIIIHFFYLEIKNQKFGTVFAIKMSQLHPRLVHSALEAKFKNF